MTPERRAAEETAAQADLASAALWRKHAANSSGAWRRQCLKNAKIAEATAHNRLLFLQGLAILEETKKETT